jgi:hypothetical protein
MFWVVLAIIAVGIIIANSIKSSIRETAMTPEQKMAAYQARQDVADGLNARELCSNIYILSRKGKSNLQIASNVTVQKYANALGANIDGEEAVRQLKLDVNFLVAVGLFDKFKALAISGISDKKIAAKLYREWDIFAVNVYTPEDIAYMRKQILGHSK